MSAQISRLNSFLVTNRGLALASLGAVTVALYMKQVDHQKLALQQEKELWATDVARLGREIREQVAESLLTFGLPADLRADLEKLQKERQL
ncbi:hypothetical protein DFS34DRAFT_691560 [Phlyctochytrium arcticum]|nr:hypothetical protein DFS34DRAFT_655074 [Phlyctochytrium arcticum]KAI9088042.1 hypothetical protein DFS34DRAFT_698657 [Phlyctochytrium arcticum]KAI9104144.1 hypothetical protein DFS34DRAFT_691560 [Phlyctochytrium arcticum]